MKTTGRARSSLVGIAAVVSLVGAALVGAAAGPAWSATQPVTITKDGYVPSSLSLTAGDTVTFTNSDSVVHEVAFKQTTGFTCTATPLVVQPSSQQSCTFTTPGTYTYTDPKQNGQGFRGTLTVAAVVVPAVTLSTSANVVRYGNPITLSGTVTPGVAGTPVDILAIEQGENAYLKIATVTTTGSGAFSFSVTTQIRTAYRAEFTHAGKAVSSAATLVQVRPRVSLALRDVTSRYAYFRTKALSTLSYSGARVLVQRRNAAGGWTTIKGVTLGAFSSAGFRVRLPRGDSRIRVLMPSSVAGPGYLAGFSRGVLVTR